ncbi:tetratricopeptide repeat protein [Aliiglaciecola sp.]|nr:tetratricopeptide repeat protein [Aliiglaciecola sp.]
MQTPGKSAKQESELITKADDYYLQMRRQDNEMAIALYEQAVAMRPESGQGQAGLANALVQQVIRWPNPADMPDIPHQNLQHAIELGRTQTDKAKRKLNRALALAEQAVSLSPNSARAHKALGFVYSAQQKFDLAIQSYQRAVELDPDAWDALINIGDVKQITHNNAQALQYFEAAFADMTRVYQSQSTRIHPWYADLGAAIGNKYYANEQTHQAETWYRHVLSFAPFNDKATAGLATILKESGDQQSAQRLCDEFEQRVGKQPCAL